MGDFKKEKKAPYLPTVSNFKFYILPIQQVLIYSNK